MKNAGLSIVSTYIFWIHHEETENEFCWDGNRNLGEFIDLCHEKELEVTLRIGPWVPVSYTHLCGLQFDRSSYGGIRVTVRILRDGDKMRWNDY